MQAARAWLALRAPGWRPAGALLCLLLFLALQVFSASHAAHRILHADSGHSGHHCVITQWSKGEVNAVAVALPVLFFAAAVIYCLPALKSAAMVPADLRLSPSRAPPRF